MKEFVSLKNLRKKFPETEALKDVSFTVEEGEIFGLLGPSGSGKTTTINILTGQMSSSGGDLEVLQHKEASLKTSKFRSEIGILTDNSALYERLTVYDNLKLFARLYKAPLSHIDEMLELVNMTDARSKQVSKLSRGMKQRILLCKALIHKPKLVFLDEPTSALDPANVRHIHRGLRKLNEEGTTIFLTTHNMEEATNLCDRVAFLHEGEIKEIGNPEDLRYKYSTGEFHILLRSGEELRLMNRAENADQMRELMAKGEIKSMHTHLPSLGEIFLDVTGKELDR